MILELNKTYEMVNGQKVIIDQIVEIRFNVICARGWSENPRICYYFEKDIGKNVTWLREYGRVDSKENDIIDNNFEI